MAVTKYIKSDTPTQVRSDLIGVQVKGQKVSGINVILDFWSPKCSSTGTGNSGNFATTATYGLTMFRDSTQKKIDGITYYRCKRVKLGDSYPQYLWKKTLSFTQRNQQLYLYDETNNQMVEYDKVSVIHTPQAMNTFTAVEVDYNSDPIVCVKSGDTSGTLYYLDRVSGCIKDADDNVMGYVTANNHMSNRSRDCVDYVETEDGGYWLSPDLMYAGPLWGPKDAKIGDRLDFCFKGNTYNPQTVNDVYYEPVEPDCDVDFSVTGETWTSAGHFDKESNVIANAPVNIYLKFSQDVEVTEE